MALTPQKAGVCVSERDMRGEKNQHKERTFKLQEAKYVLAIIM